MFVQCWCILGKGWRRALRMKQPNHIFPLSGKKVGGFRSVLWMEASFHLSLEIYVTKNVVNNFKWTQQSHPEFGFSVSRFPRQWVRAWYMAPAVATQFPAVESATAFRNSGLWPVDICVFTDDGFGPSMVTDRTDNPSRETSRRRSWGLHRS
jgi:hypothetical protein